MSANARFLASRTRRRPPPLRYRLAVASRVLAALFAGYFVAYGSTAFLTLALPFERANRVVTASLLCFAVWCAAALYAFAARSAWRAWWVLLLVGGGLLGVALLAGDFAARP